MCMWNVRCFDDIYIASENCTIYIPLTLWRRYDMETHATLLALCEDNPPVNTLRPWQNGRHFPDNIFKCILLNENVWISLKISLKFVPQGPIYNIPALVQIMTWRRPDKPLSGPMMVKLPTHICVTRLPWVLNSQDDFFTGQWHR